MYLKSKGRNGQFSVYFFNPTFVRSVDVIGAEDVVCKSKTEMKLWERESYPDRQVKYV